MSRKIRIPALRLFGLAALFIFLQINAFADNKDFPDMPNPPRLVNDLAGSMSAGQQAQLEQQLDDFSRTSSNQITIVTVKSLGDYDVADYATQLGNKWGVGKAGKDNGVVVLASLQEHKINISPGRGLEGALTDAMCGRIIRNEMAPSFKEGDYFTGFSKAANAIIAATKGEYKGDPNDNAGSKHFPVGAVILIIIFVIWAISRMRGGGGNGGGNYMSRGGFGSFATGMFLGNLLGGGNSGGGWGGGSGGNSGGGGFGGFGGGGFGGGGASGSW